MLPFLQYQDVLLSSRPTLQVTKGLSVLLLIFSVAGGLRQLRGTTPAANTRTPTSTPAKTPSIPTTTKIPTTPATTTNTPTTPATTTNTPTTASASVTAAPSTTATTKTATVATPSITPSTNCISTCYTLMASWVGDGAEPVPPAFPRYSKAKCSEMGTKLASALNIMVRQNPDIEPMAKPFHRTACILGSGDSYMGVQGEGGGYKALAVLSVNSGGHAQAGLGVLIPRRHGLMYGSRSCSRCPRRAMTSGSRVARAHLGASRYPMRR